MKVLIEHFSPESNAYREYHQKIVNLNLDEILNLLKSLPKFDKKLKNNARLVTKEYIFYRKNNEKFIIQNNRQFIRIASMATLSYLTYSRGCNMDEIYSILNKSKKKEVASKSYIEIILVLIFYPLLPIFNLIMIFLNFSIMIANTNNIIIFSVLIILSFLDIVYLFQIGNKELRRNYFRKLRIEIPYYNCLEIKNLSEEVIRYSQSLYFILFIVYGFSLELIFKNLTLTIIFWIGVILMFTQLLLLPIYSILTFLKIKKKKKKCEREILRKMFQAEGEQKNYYLTLYNLIEGKKLVVADFISIVIGFITFIFTVIPTLVSSSPV